MSTDTTMVQIGDEELSLADLAGIDLSGIKEFRAGATPAGVFHWRITGTEIVSKEVPVDYDDELKGKINMPYVNFNLESQNCFSLVDADLNPESYIGISFTKKFKIQDAEKDLGKVVAFLTDIGLEGNKPLGDLLDEAHGVEFTSHVTNKANPDNPDFVWVNLDKIMSMEEFNEKHGGDVAEEERVA